METHLLLIPLSIVSLIACRIVAMLRPGLNLKASREKRHHAISARHTQKRVFINRCSQLRRRRRRWQTYGFFDIFMCLRNMIAPHRLHRHAATDMARGKSTAATHKTWNLERGPSMSHFVKICKRCGSSRRPSWVEFFDIFAIFSFVTLSGAVARDKKLQLFYCHSRRRRHKCVI